MASLELIAKLYLRVMYEVYRIDDGSRFGTAYHTRAQAEDARGSFDILDSLSVRPVLVLVLGNECFRLGEHMGTAGEVFPDA